MVEGYPVKPPEGVGRIASASAYTGTLPFFLKQGFERMSERPRGKQRVRKRLGRGKPAKIR